jgi:putative GTP pyrophosphokinase
MVDAQEKKLEQWYASRRPFYEALGVTVKNTIEHLIRSAKIDFLSVTSRAKSSESFMGKVERKTYKHPEHEITDFAGIRVITFIESDVPKVCDIVRSAFNVHPTESLDKSEELGIDRFGYRSVHFVCDLGEDRSRLPEFAAFDGLVFEIQVRTVLQHAWAEIEHDRNYKFAGVLPSQLRRRLNLLAGILEIVDREFGVLAQEVDNYALEVAKKAGAGNLEIELNSTSLLQYLPEKTRWFEKTKLKISSVITEDIINELVAFGITTLSGLDRILTEQVFALAVKHQNHQTYLGLIRDAMMFEDIERYFSVAWNHGWEQIDDGTFDFLTEKYEKDYLNRVLAEYHIELLDDDIDYEQLLDPE